MAQHKPQNPTKPCKYCGEPIAWSRNLAPIWDGVMFCDNACKRRYNRENPPEAPEGFNLKGPAGQKKRRRLAAS
ncbi:MAG: DUF2256 domain-containing protein [Proteobacteria bacterium]|nr:DUF2256 domain-containing protein [Pseudomonadota bacterium]